MNFPGGGLVIRSGASNDLIAIRLCNRSLDGGIYIIKPVIIRHNNKAMDVLLIHLAFRRSAKDFINSSLQLQGCFHWQKSAH